MPRLQAHLYTGSSTTPHRVHVGQSYDRLVPDGEAARHPVSLTAAIL